MDASERDVVDSCDRYRMRDLLLRQSKQLSRAGGSRNRKLDRVIETLCHDRHHGGEPALDLERNSKREHELFA